MPGVGAQQAEGLFDAVLFRCVRVPQVVLPRVVMRAPLAQRSLSIASILPPDERLALARSCGTVPRPTLCAA